MIARCCYASPTLVGRQPLSSSISFFLRLSLFLFHFLPLPLPYFPLPPLPLLSILFLFPPPLRFFLSRLSSSSFPPPSFPSFLSSCSSSSRHRAGRCCRRPLVPASFRGWPSPARRRGGWRPPFGGRRSGLLRRLCLFLSFAFSVCSIPFSPASLLSNLWDFVSTLYYQTSYMTIVHSPR